MSHYPQEPPAAYDAEKGYGEKTKVQENGEYGYDETVEQHRRMSASPGDEAPLHRDLQGRHMQMIAIGGAIGAGLFVGSGKALAEGGPASLVICFFVVGMMMFFVMQALAELGVMFPVNGAFFTYAVRFVDPSWGFAIGWDYAIQWLTVLPFEITAAGLTLQFWKASRDINIGAWITIFLFCLCIIQFFGVRGYGEVEFVLSMIKVIACTGFIIFGIIVDCGGAGPKGYLGARYWYNPGAFRNGFAGFCNVFATASFAYGGTELTGLAAAEAADPIKSIPRATKQVLWRILIFYVVSLFIVGLIVPYDDKRLLGASNSNTKASCFVLAFVDAGVKVMPSIFNGVITISVLSVANSCSFGSTRTMQALAAQGMGPKFLAYVDKKGRPLWCVVIQMAFGLLAFINEAPNAGSQFFTWLLALTGVANFFVWGTILLSHIRYRKAWKYHGHSLDEIPFRAQAGVWGSYVGLLLCWLCIMASFYSALGYPHPSAETWFENYLAAPLILALYLFWKVYSRHWQMLVPIADMDIMSGTRHNLEELRMQAEQNRLNKTWGNLPMRVVRNLF